MRSGKRDGVNAPIMFVALGCVLSACVRFGSPAPNTAAAEVLWLPAGARLEEDAARPVLVRNGRSIYVNGSGAVVFSAAADCDDIARDISEHFNRTGWQPRPTQELNPQLATSFGSGCQRYGGGVIAPWRTIPHEPYKQWHGEWENEDGDLVTYVVGGTGRQLRGYGSYAPRDVVGERRRRLGR